MRALLLVLAACGSGPGTMTGPDETPDAAPLEPLIPLAPHNAWTYAMTQGSISCTVVDTLTGTQLVDGKMAFVDSRDRQCKKGDQTAVVYIAEDNDAIDTRAMTDTGWTHLDPPVDGHMWEAEPGVSCTWHDAGSVTVAAGTFSSCWTADQDGLSSTYCRGVGLVQTTQTSAGGIVTTLELTQKSF